MGCRICRVEALDVREDDQRIGIDERRDHRREIVVIPDLDLVDGDGIVLIDDWHGPHREQGKQRIARVAVLVVTHGVLLRQEHLADGLAVLGEELLVDMHEHALADGGNRLLLRDGVRLLREAELAEARRDGARGDEDDLAPLIHEVGQLPQEMVDAVEVEHARIMGKRTRADFDDDAPGFPEPLTCVHTASLRLTAARSSASRNCA